VAVAVQLGDLGSLAQRNASEGYSCVIGAITQRVVCHAAKATMIPRKKRSQISPGGNSLHCRVRRYARRCCHVVTI